MTDHYHGSWCTHQNIDTLKSVSRLLSLSLGPLWHKGVEINPFATPIDDLNVFL